MRYAIWTFEGQGSAIQLEKEDTYYEARQKYPGSKAVMQALSGKGA